MTEYRIFETRQFRRDLDSLSRGGQRRIAEKLRRAVYPDLRAHPHFDPHIRKLTDWEPPTWRVRIGAWRFFYEIDEAARVVLMIAASHRSSAY